MLPLKNCICRKHIYSQEWTEKYNYRDMVHVYVFIRKNQSNRSSNLDSLIIDTLKWSYEKNFLQYLTTDGGSSCSVFSSP